MDSVGLNPLHLTRRTSDYFPYKEIGDVGTVGPTTLKICFYKNEYTVINSFDVKLRKERKVFF